MVKVKNNVKHKNKSKSIKTYGQIKVPEKKLDIVANPEVAVLGGGTSGFIAAIASARTGAETLLIEKNGFIGGEATGTFNTNLSSNIDSEYNRIMGGVGWEFIERMARKREAIVDKEKNRKPAIFSESIKMIAQDMVEEAGVDVLLYTWAGEVIMEGEQIKGIIIQNKSGQKVIQARTYIDATGDADIAYKAGAPYEQLDPQNTWITSLDLTVCNIDEYKLIKWAQNNANELGNPSLPEEKDLNSYIRKPYKIIVKGPRLKKREDGTVYREGRALGLKMMIHPGVTRVQGHVQIDGTDARQITWAQLEARRQAMQDFYYLKENIPGFENAYVISQSPIGIRETRRILGDYRLTIDDLLNNARFDDVVGLNARPLDRHTDDDKFEIKSLKGNHDIPLRTLIPQDVDNLLVAGRSISCDHDSHASLRGGGTCMITGHAAGTAASIAGMEDGIIRNIDVHELQKTLIKQKVVLSTDASREFI